MIFLIAFLQKIFFSIVCSQSLIFLTRRMQSATCYLKFCGVLAPVACVILAHAASRMMFHGY